MNWFATHTIALAIGICLGIFFRGGCISENTVRGS